MPNSRYELRTATGLYFGGSTIESGTGARINGPLNANGLSAVYDRFPKRIPDTDYYKFTGSTSRNMGALMVVHIPRIQERRLSIGGLNSGTKEDTVQVILHLYHLAQVTHAETAESDLEQLIDSIYDLIDADKTLGGIFVGAGETAYGIQSEMGIPYVKEPERIEQYATVSFESSTFYIA